MFNRLGGRFGIVFGRLGGRFGPLGGVLGHSWAVLNRLGAVLGRVDAPGGVRIKIGPALGSVFCSILAPQEGAKTTPRRTKIDQKIVLKNDRVLERS